MLQLSDLHLRAEPGASVLGVDPDARLATVLATWVASARRADLVLLTGDIADDGSREACERVAAALGQLEAPVMAVSGNHDRTDVVAEVFGSATAAELDGWRVVGLDTTVPGEGHGVADVAAATTWLDELDARPTVLALHHPPLSRSTSPYFQLDGAQELLAALATRPHVKAIVSGHLHDAAELRSSAGVRVLCGPSVVMAIEHHDDQMELAPSGAAGARVLLLEDDGSLESELLLA